MRRVLFSFVLLCVCSGRGAIIELTATNGFCLDLYVNAQIAAAADGDTIIVPPSSTYWTNALVINPAVRVMGYGTNKTIWYDYIAAADKIWVKWQSSLRPNTHYARLSGVHWVNGNRSVANWAFNGSVAIGATGNAKTGAFCRLDHHWFDNIYAQPLSTKDVNLLSDHCYFDIFTNKNAFVNYAYNAEWSGGTFGDGSWADPIDHTAAATNWVSFRYNVIRHRFFAYTAFDGQQAERYDIGNNEFTNSNMTVHGTENNHRGHRLTHCYNNNFTLESGVANSQVHIFGAIRSGCAIICSNNAYGAYNLSTLAAGVASAYRMTGIAGQDTFYGADGRNRWDSNSISNPFITGTCTASYNPTNNQSVTIMTDTNAAWTNNALVGYTLVNLERMTNATYEHFGLISANTATNITTVAPFDASGGVTALAWTNGNHYEINLVRYTLDQAGASPGLSLTNGRPNPTPTNWPSQFPNNTNDLCYAWGNRFIVPGVSTNTFDMKGAQSCREGESFTNAVLAGFAPWDPSSAISGSALLPTAGTVPVPASGATGINPTLVNISWTAGSYAFDGYQVFLDTSNPPTTLITTTENTTATVSSLAQGATYFWKVISTNYDGSTSSAVWNFTTSGPPNDQIPGPPTTLGLRKR